MMEYNYIPRPHFKVKTVLITSKMQNIISTGNYKHFDGYDTMNPCNKFDQCIR